MPFIETEASVRYETINGKKVPVITPKCEVTLTNTVTGQEYMSDAEALADVQNASTDTKAEHIKRDVNITVEEIKIGADFNISDYFYLFHSYIYISSYMFRFCRCTCILYIC